MNLNLLKKRMRLLKKEMKDEDGIDISEFIKKNIRPMKTICFAEYRRILRENGFKATKKGYKMFFRELNKHAMILLTAIIRVGKYDGKKIITEKDVFLAIKMLKKMKI